MSMKGITPWEDRRKLGDFKKGHTRSTRITDPEELLAVYADYGAHCFETNEPQATAAFLMFASNRMGVNLTLVIWANLSKGNKFAAKNVPGLSEAVDLINTGIAGNLQIAGLKETVHPGIAAKMLDTIENRAETKAANEAASAEDRDSTPGSPPEQIANVLHPDMTFEQEMALRKAGIPVPLYTRQLLDLGVPFHMPALPADKPVPPPPPPPVTDND